MVLGLLYSSAVMFQRFFYSSKYPEPINIVVYYKLSGRRARNDVDFRSSERSGSRLSIIFTNNDKDRMNISINRNNARSTRSKTKIIPNV